VIGWSCRSFDTVIKDPEKLFNRIEKSIKGGDVILFHDQSESMFKMLPAFLEHLNKVGLKVVRVDELLKEKAYA
jgi:peptidoglycan-N-acetylglucosamine deacetylase